MRKRHCKGRHLWGRWIPRDPETPPGCAGVYRRYCYGCGWFEERRQRYDDTLILPPLTPSLGP